MGKIISEEKKLVDQAFDQIAGLEIKKVKFLVLGQKELIEMVALKEAGVGKIRSDEFKNDLFNLIIKTIISLINFQQFRSSLSFMTNNFLLIKTLNPRI